MPIADARVRLPRVGADDVGGAALDVLDERADVRRLYVLAVHHHIRPPAVARGAEVVVVRHHIQPGLPQRQFVGIEIEHVRLVLIHQVLAAQIPVLAERSGGMGLLLARLVLAVYHSLTAAAP